MRLFRDFSEFWPSKRPNKQQSEHLSKQITLDPNYSFDTGGLLNLSPSRLIATLLELDPRQIQLQQPFFDDCGYVGHCSAYNKWIAFYDYSVQIWLWPGEKSVSESWAEINIKGQPPSEIIQCKNPELYAKATKLFDKWFKLYNDTIGMDYSKMSIYQICTVLYEELHILSVQPEIVLNETKSDNLPAFIIDNKFRLSRTVDNEYNLEILDECQKHQKRKEPNNPIWAKVVKADNILTDEHDTRCYTIAQDRMVPELYWKCVEKVYGKGFNKSRTGLLAGCQKQKLLAQAY